MRTKKTKIIKGVRIDLNLIRNKRIAIIGYGSQGRAQALNLKDTGFRPKIGLPLKSNKRRQAKRDGFKITTPRLAVRDADIAVILAPDHKHKELFENELYPVIQAKQIFVFAHALSVHFGLISQPDGVDFVLVAPHSPGLRMRERFLGGKGVTAFIGRTELSAKKSLKIAAAYGGAIGCAKDGMFVTSFAHEAVGDIFGEQVVLCGGLSALLKSGFETLVKAGLPPENAYLECVYQIDLIVDLIKRHGIRGMYDRISKTAAFGAAMAESRIINPRSRKAMKDILKDIEKGDFVEDLMADYAKGFKKFKARQKKIDSGGMDKMAGLFSRDQDL
jgi:ketol-acid reductoisomerase